MRATATSVIPMKRVRRVKRMRLGSRGATAWTNDDCASNKPLGAMATAWSGHVSCECQHAHAEPWAWHPIIGLVGCADIGKRLLQALDLFARWGVILAGARRTERKFVG